MHRGITGFISTHLGDPVNGVTIKVKGIDHVTKSADDGDYWKLLMPGKYTVSYSKEG